MILINNIPNSTISSSTSLFGLPSCSMNSTMNGGNAAIPVTTPLSPFNTSPFPYQITPVYSFNVPSPTSFAPSPMYGSKLSPFALSPTNVKSVFPVLKPIYNNKSRSPEVEEYLSKHTSIPFVAKATDPVPKGYTVFTVNEFNNYFNSKSTPSLTDSNSGRSISSVSSDANINIEHLNIERHVDSQSISRASSPSPNARSRSASPCPSNISRSTYSNFFTESYKSHQNKVQEVLPVMKEMLGPYLIPKGKIINECQPLMLYCKNAESLEKVVPFTRELLKKFAIKRADIVGRKNFTKGFLCIIEFQNETEVKQALGTLYKAYKSPGFRADQVDRSQGTVGSLKSKKKQKNNPKMAKNKKYKRCYNKKSKFY